MSKRISHSLLDPWFGPRIKALYPHLKIPKWFPPEGIILVGHLSAIIGAIGLAFSTTTWWGGVVACLGIAGNHFADCIDGTHARSTGQCRNGGELLDHFTDPVSFSYWLIGLAYSCGRLEIGLALVVILFATAVLTNIKAKILGEFTLSTIGPTEFKTVLCVYGLILSGLALGAQIEILPLISFWFVVVLAVGGVVQLLVNLWSSVREVNEQGAAPDTTEWENVRAETAEKLSLTPVKTFDQSERKLARGFNSSGRFVILKVRKINSFVAMPKRKKHDDRCFG